MNLKQALAVAAICLLALPAGKCMANLNEVIGVVQAGLGWYQAAKLRNCDAIDDYVQDIMDTNPSCKTKNLILDLQAASEQSCKLAASPNPPANNFTKAGIIIDNTLQQIKANRLKC